MTIEWLDPFRRRARVTKGWLRKRWALVEQSGTDDAPRWRFADSVQPVSERLVRVLMKAKQRPRSPWRPFTPPLP